MLFYLKVLFYKFYLLFSIPKVHPTLKYKDSKKVPSLTFSEKNTIKGLRRLLRKGKLTYLETSLFINYEIWEAIKSNDYDLAEKKIKELNNFSLYWLSKFNRRSNDKKTDEQ